MKSLAKTICIAPIFSDIFCGTLVKGRFKKENISSTGLGTIYTFAKPDMDAQSNYKWIKELEYSNKGFKQEQLYPEMI